MALERYSAEDGYLDVLERVLDKGIVIDASVQVSLVGLEVLRLDAWVVVASIDTYLRHDDLVRQIAGGEVMRDLLPEPERQAALQPGGS